MIIPFVNSILFVLQRRQRQVWGVLRCQRVYRASDPAWRSRRLPSRQDRQAAPATTHREHGNYYLRVQ